MFDIDRILNYISQFCTLLPGDLIATGTPEGVGRCGAEMLSRLGGRHWNAAQYGGGRVVQVSKLEVGIKGRSRVNCPTQANDGLNGHD